MNMFKRWTTAVTSSFDWVINQVENHDAIVSAAIREMQQAGAKAKVQLERVRRDGERMRHRISELQDMDAVWAERAVRVHDQDRDKALECLRRRNGARRETAALQRQCEEHARLEEQLSRDLKLIDERIGELRRKKNSFTARQYRAEAMKAGQLSELGLIGEIDDIFDRWELKVTQYESILAEKDRLDEEFKREEDDALLNTQLDELIHQDNSHAGEAEA